MFEFVISTQQLIVCALLLMDGVGAAAGDCPFRITDTVPDVERAMTVRSGEVGEQFVLMQMVNITGLTIAPTPFVAVACPRWSKRIVIGYESPASETTI